MAINILETQKVLESAPDQFLDMLLGGGPRQPTPQESVRYPQYLAFTVKMRRNEMRQAYAAEQAEKSMTGRTVLQDMLSGIGGGPPQNMAGAEMMSRAQGGAPVQYAGQGMTSGGPTGPTPPQAMRPSAPSARPPTQMMREGGTVQRYANKGTVKKKDRTLTKEEIEERYGELIDVMLERMDSDLVTVDGAYDAIIELIAAESSGDPLAVSHRGAKGLTQFMPKTFDEMAELIGIPPGEDSMFNPEHSVMAAVAYLDQNFNRSKDRFEGLSDKKHFENALSFYNYGPGKKGPETEKWYVEGGDHPVDETDKYVKRISKAMDSGQRPPSWDRGDDAGGITSVDVGGGVPESFKARMERAQEAQPSPIEAMLRFQAERGGATTPGGIAGVDTRVAVPASPHSDIFGPRPMELAPLPPDPLTGWAQIFRGDDPSQPAGRFEKLLTSLAGPGSGGDASIESRVAAMRPALQGKGFLSDMALTGQEPTFEQLGLDPYGAPVEALPWSTLLEDEAIPGDPDWGALGVSPTSTTGSSRLARARARSQKNISDVMAERVARGGGGSLDDVGGDATGSFSIPGDPGPTPSPPAATVADDSLKQLAAELNVDDGVGDGDDETRVKSRRKDGEWNWYDTMRVAAEVGTTKGSTAQAILAGLKETGKIGSELGKEKRKHGYRMEEIGELQKGYGDRASLQARARVATSMMKDARSDIAYMSALREMYPDGPTPEEERAFMDEYMESKIGGVWRIISGESVGSKREYAGNTVLGTPGA